MEVRRPQARTRMRGIIPKLVLAMVSIGLSLLVIEIGFRLVGFQPIFETYSKPSLFWQADDLLGWVHTPKSEGQYIGPRPWPVEFSSEVQINSLGLRGPEVAELPPGGVRILFTGDSVLAGFEVEYDETFVARLSKSLTRELGYPVQAINAGVRGYGTDQSYLYYRERGHKLKPDVVVFVASYNDILDNVTLHRMRRPFGKAALRASGEQLELVGHPVPSYPLCSSYRVNDRFEIVREDGGRARALCWLQLNLADHSAFFTFAANVIRQNPKLLHRLYGAGATDEQGSVAKSLQSPESFETRLMTNILRGFAKDVIERKAAFVLAGRSSTLEGANMQRVRGAGARVVELDAVCSDDCRDLQFRRDGHWNPDGHQRVAHVLAKALKPIVTGVARRLRVPAGSGEAKDSAPTPP